VTKTHRHRLIARLLNTSNVRSQEQLRALLLEAGVRATQGTLSRDLRELGVVKSPSGYTLSQRPTESGKGLSDLERSLESHLLSSEFAGNVVVLKTEPGHANLLAAEVDRSTPTGVVGSVAGDDTIFLVARSPKVARSVSIQLSKLAGIL
jgi:transcriptional regulator of arginine metabolism